MPDTVIAVKIVDENELPQGHEWALVRRARTKSEPPRKWLFIKRGAGEVALVEAEHALREIHRY